MFIKTEKTPNPAVMKFLPGMPVMETGLAEFHRKEEAEKSPLAAALFDMGGICGVFFGQDFVSVTKEDTQDWGDLKPKILFQMMEYFSSGAPLFHPGAAQSPETNENDSDDEITTQIKDLLDTRVRPMVAMDGGDIDFDRFEDGIVYLRMRGACAGCPSATMTLKSGIESMLRHYVPEVLEVRPVEG